MCLVHEFMNILRFMLCCELQLSRIGKKNFREYSLWFRTEKAIHYNYNRERVFQINFLVLLEKNYTQIAPVDTQNNSVQYTHHNHYDEEETSADAWTKFKQYVCVFCIQSIRNHKGKEEENKNACSVYGCRLRIQILFMLSESL